MMTYALVNIIIITVLCEAWGMDNSPPVLVLDREWQIPSTEPVGSVITRVRGTDAEGDPLSYGLERAELMFGAPTVAPKTPLPFRIDHDSGVVYLNQSLANKEGENMYLHVTVSDGKLTQKTAVWVTVLGPNGAGRGSRPKPPGYYHPTRTRPESGLLPPVGIPRPLPVPVPPPIPVLISTTTTTTAIAELITTTPVSTTVSTIVSTTSTPPPPPPKANLSSSDLALTIVPLAVASTLLTLAIVATFMFRKRICRQKKASSEDMKKKKMGWVREEAMSMSHWTGPTAAANRYEAYDTPTVQENNSEKTGDKWEFPRHQLKVFNMVGEGCFGQVWRCEAHNIDGKEGTSVVAMKTMKENAGESERKDLLKELEVMKGLDTHPNVVRLIGCCTDKDPVFVIMEFLSKGKLQSLLRNSRAERSYNNLHGRSDKLTSHQLTSFCYQVAKGMQYLSSKGIIHRDLAARNILVGEDMICKVADFGFARDITDTHVYERKSDGRLPIRWMAPECLCDNIFTHKSDVWSFGILMWEVVTLGSTPYPGLSAAEVLRKVKEGFRLDKPEHCRRELYNIMFYCWDKEPENRPDFQEAVELLDNLLISETDYIELELFPEHCYLNVVSLSGEKV